MGKGNRFFTEYFNLITEYSKAIDYLVCLCYDKHEGGRFMKCKIIIDLNKEEEVIVYAHQKEGLDKRIEDLVNSFDDEIIGQSDKGIYKLKIQEIYCFISEGNKVYALTDKGRLQIKYRLYEIEEKVGKGFVKVNQSCIVNVSKIEKFDVTFATSLTVIMKNGYKDYVSRRQLKEVKERIGFK